MEEALQRHTNHFPKKKRITIDLQPSFVLSERDRQVFFDALVAPPKPNARLKRAFKAARKRIAP